jgi:hypothetical protein
MSDSMLGTPSLGAARGRVASLARHQTLWYSVVLATAVVVAAYFGLRNDGILACGASGYLPGRYLSHCEAESYGDYDHGAFWFNLEPDAVRAARQAQLVLLGNSRAQLAFSSVAAQDSLSALGIPYYLLGFSHHGNYRFEEPLLRRLQPPVRVLLVNIDLFFEQTDTPPAHVVLTDPTAKQRYEQKRRWQGIHKLACSTVPVACRDEFTFFRMRATGAWVVRGGHSTNAPVEYEGNLDGRIVATYVAAGRGFLSRLPLAPSCVIFTVVPTPHTDLVTAQAIADSLGVPLIAPQVDSLMTFDASHLDQASAERWSAAFFGAASLRIRDCIAGVAAAGGITPGPR